MLSTTAAVALIAILGVQSPQPPTPPPAAPQSAAPKQAAPPSATPKPPAKPKAAPPAAKGGPFKGPIAPMPTTPVPLPSKKKPAKLPYEKRVNLNAASREELMKLPLVDGPQADKIIAGRPYKLSAELMTRGIVPGAHFYTLKGLVTAGPLPGQPLGTIPTRK